MWNKNVTELNSKEIDDARKILADARSAKSPTSPARSTRPTGPEPRAPAKVRSAINSAPISTPARKKGFSTIALNSPARSAPTASGVSIFGGSTIKSRIAPPSTQSYADAADRCAKSGIILLLENEMSCNTATGEEAAAVLAAIPHKNFMLNWDPGNAAAIGVYPYSKGYDLLPKNRIGHCHAKDVVRKPDNKGYDWAPVGAGVVDWTDQLKALVRDHYSFAVSLETHWRGAGTPEASTRISMDGLKKTLSAANVNC